MYADYLELFGKDEEIILFYTKAMKKIYKYQVKVGNGEYFRHKLPQFPLPT